MTDEASAEDFLEALMPEMDGTIIDNYGVDDEDEGHANAPEVPKSPTALELDRWSHRMGREFLRRGPTVKNTVSEVARGDVNNPNQNDMDLAAADLFSLAWEPRPQLAAATEHPRRARFFQALMETPQYQTLHNSTRLDTVASEIAAVEFSKQYAVLVNQPEEEGLEGDSQALGAAMEGLKDAKDGVDSLNELRDSIMGDRGMGSGPGTAAPLSSERMRQMLAQSKKNHQMAEVMKLSGKYRRMAQSMQSRKHCHGSDETIGIDMSSEIHRVLPAEFALLDDDYLEWEFYRRYTDGSLMSREVRDTKGTVAGPVVIVVDESGSMNGDRIHHAKAMALAMLWIARHQKRWCCLVGFSGSEQGNYLVIPPGFDNEGAIMNWVKHFFSGGTDVDVPLVELPERWSSLGCPKGKTDIVQITDALVRVDSSVEQRFNDWKKENQVMMRTIVIGMEGHRLIEDDRPENEFGTIACVSDQWWGIPDLNVGEDAVQECLSV